MGLRALLLCRLSLPVIMSAFVAPGGRPSTFIQSHEGHPSEADGQPPDVSAGEPVDVIASLIAGRLTSEEDHAILYVDVGAGSGSHPSVTRALHSTIGGRGLCVEPRVDAYTALVRNRPDCKAHRVALGESGWRIQQHRCADMLAAKFESGHLGVVRRQCFVARGCESCHGARSRTEAGRSTAAPKPAVP